MRYMTLPNEHWNKGESLVSVAVEDHGWEVYGYSQYGSDGIPSRVELRKED